MGRWGEEPLFYRFLLILYESLTALLFLLFMLISETHLTQTYIHTTFRAFSFVQSGVLVTIMVWVCTSGIIRRYPIVLYIVANLIRSYAFCLSVFFLLPPYDWIWFFSPVYLMLVKIFSWYCYEWQSLGIFELRHPKIFDDNHTEIYISTEHTDCSQNPDRLLIDPGPGNILDEENKVPWMNHHLSHNSPTDFTLPSHSFETQDENSNVGDNLELKIEA